MTPPLRKPSPILRRSIFRRFFDFVCCQKKKRIRQYVNSLYLEDKSNCDRTSNCDFDHVPNATSTNLGVNSDVTANLGVHSDVTANFAINSDVTANLGVNSGSHFWRFSKTSFGYTVGSNRKFSTDNFCDWARVNNDFVERKGKAKYQGNARFSKMIKLLSWEMKCRVFLLK